MGELDQVFEKFNKKNREYSKEKWIEFKKQEKQDVYNLIDTTAEKIISNGQEFKKYLDTQSKFEQYSVGNILLVTAQMPQATMLKDYESWIKIGGYPKKNRNDIKILEPADSYMRDDGSIGQNYNVKYLTDISQVNTRQKPRIMRYDNKLLLRVFLNSSQAEVQVVDEITGIDRSAFYDKNSDVLYIARGAEVPQIFHEVTHELAKQEIGENNTLDSFKEILEPINHDRVKFLNIQDVEDEIEEGMKLIEKLVDYASKFEREDVHISKLKIGLKCGGSDAFSGITANPLLGRLSDEIIRLGGTSIQTEVPEMFGAETILFDRAIDKDVFDRSVHLINDFKEYFIRYDQVIYENPSPGNKKGGITTLEEKSLGCVQKGGKSIVTDVLRYGDKSTKTGLNLLYGPGNDQVAVTVLAAAGAHMVLFTTGRGTPFGGTVPTLKISTNTDLYNKKKHWIDFNAGQILEDHDFESLDESFFKMIVDTASGEYVAHNEKNGYKEISILKDGVTL